MAGASTIKVSKRVLDRGAELQRHIERYGWDSLEPEQQGFFEEGITRGSIVEAAYWLLARQLCLKASDDKE